MTVKETIERLREQCSSDACDCVLSSAIGHLRRMEGIETTATAVMKRLYSLADEGYDAPGEERGSVSASTVEYVADDLKAALAPTQSEEAK